VRYPTTTGQWPANNLQLGLHLFYDSFGMKSNEILRCDGCGQMGSPEHIARRLRRLEWATRYRPVHIQTMLLGGVAPREDAEFLYSPGEEFRGEAEILFHAVGIESGRRRFEAEDMPESGRPQKAVPTTASPAGETVERNGDVKSPLQAIHAEFQAAGFFLAHILECPLEDAQGSAGDSSEILRKHLPAVAARIRRSLKPKRVILVTEMPEEVVQDILALDLGCEVILSDGRPFALTPSVNEVEITRFRALVHSRAVR